MAAYFHGASEIHPEGLQTLYLMNPGFAGYSDAAGSPAENMVFMNSGGPPPLPQQQFFGIPLPSPAENSVGRFHQNLWSPATPVSNYFGRGTIQRGLSLSLSSQQTPPYSYRPEEITAPDDDVVKFMGAPAAAGASGLQSVLMNSKYLKVAREVLDEMASVGGDGGGAESAKKELEKSPARYEGKSCGKPEAELTAADRQDLQMKKAKLLGMLDEVEQRYRQYHHQMRIIVSSFEAAAGHGAAKTYTALALQTISKQFRCLRDAISGQIRAAGRNLGEEDCPAQGGGKSIGSRLRLVDHHLRQQRALQQLGMMQPNGWRPQRGLPERAVSILRAWLFEHFLHPYPKDSDKLMLAKQTGLTRSQVSNWFINARVRLWKPMVEEMYVEEIKEQERKNDDDAEKRSYSDVNDESTSKAGCQPKPEHASTLPSMKNTAHPSSTAIPSLNYEISQAGDEEMLMQPFSQKGRTAMQHPMAPVMKSPAEMISSREILMNFHGGSFGGYSVEENVGQHFAPRFRGSGGVSLTLGLPHCDSMAFPGAVPGFLSSDSSNQQASRDSNSYGRIEIQSSKRFAAQLLPDFVA